MCILYLLDVMGKNPDLLFLKSEKAILGRKKHIFKSYSSIKNLKKSGNPGISGELASLHSPPRNEAYVCMVNSK